MTQAEKKAFDAYPIKEEWIGNQYGGLEDVNKELRNGFIEGYKQAEKDLTLTWEDMKEIVRVADGMMYSADSLADIEKRLGLQHYYAEVLTRFKQFKEAKK